ncbi:hypothetical protein BT67DRAFT_348454, partial [Trichocladium antarcticum]
RYDLDRYILTDVPEPDDAAAKQTWREDRRDVDDYLLATVSDDKIWEMLECLGWDATKIDPKKTFDKLTQY